MSDIRRYYIPGAPVFLTLVCVDRSPLLAGDAPKDHFLSDLRAVRRTHPFRMHAYVVLDDHVHLLISPAHPNFSNLVRDLRSRFAYTWARHFNAGVRRRLWQFRYWDHVIRDDTDMQRHIDYVHYNPVKHAATTNASAYRHSSLALHIERSLRPGGWGDNGEPVSIERMELE